MVEIFVDGDACPVKDEVYRVAANHWVQVVLVANSAMRTPDGLGVEMVVVDQGPDVADDWIAESVRAGDIVVTADIPLAARCLERGARVLGTDGRPFTEDSIGAALASRELNAELRERGVLFGGPSGVSARDRSRFLNELECVHGEVWANVWRTDSIVRIEPSSGRVTARVDASSLRAAAGGGGVLNGIAYRRENDSFLLTGKNWPKVFEVTFVERR